MLNERRLDAVRMVFRLLPEMAAYGFKTCLLRWCGVEVGYGVRVCSSVHISGGGRLVLGDHAWIGSLATLRASPNSTLSIGHDVDIAPRVTLWTGTHNVQIGRSKAAGPGISKDIVIGNGAWLAMGAMVLPGCQIGECCVVAAGAVVDKDVPRRTLVAGVPAEVKKTL